MPSISQFFLTPVKGYPSPWDLAEELTQETFYQAVRSIDRFDGTCKLSVWLFWLSSQPAHDLKHFPDVHRLCQMLIHSGVLCQRNILIKGIGRQRYDRHGFRVPPVEGVTANNGKAAVDTFSAAEPWSFHCVLMDLMMPVMSGYEATRVIRTVSSHRLSGEG